MTGEERKQLYEELRQLAKKYKVSFETAHQPNRGKLHRQPEIVRPTILFVDYIEQLPEQGGVK